MHLCLWYLTLVSLRPLQLTIAPPCSSCKTVDKLVDARHGCNIYLYNLYLILKEALVRLELLAQMNWQTIFRPENLPAVLSANPMLAGAADQGTYSSRGPSTDKAQGQADC